MIELLTIEEVAQILRVSDSQVRYWVRLGYIPHIRLGRQIRFRLDDLDRWLRSEEPIKSSLPNTRRSLRLLD